MNPFGNTGHSAPLRATVVDGGVNFSLYSRSATGCGVTSRWREIRVCNDNTYE
jgi:hypothetical protein